MKKILLEEDKIVATIGQIPSRSFTVLDFSTVFKTLYPADWQRLIARFGQLGEKRRYTIPCNHYPQYIIATNWFSVYQSVSK
jgi:hypothetical protein